MVCVPPAFAEPREEELVQLGIKLRRERRDAEALAQFRLAYQAQPSPRTLVQIGLAEQALDRFVEAERDLETALKADGDPWIRRNQGELRENLTAIRSRLAWLDVEGRDGAELWLNGVQVGRLPHKPVRIVAGVVSVQVRAIGFASWRRTLEARTMETLRVIVELAPVAPPAKATTTGAPLAARQAEQNRSIIAAAPGQRMVGWGLMAVGGGLLLAGATAQVFHERASSHYNDDTLCFYGNLSRDQRCGRYRGQAETTQIVAVAGWVTGGAAIASGLVLVLTSPRRPPSSVRLGRRADAWQVVMEGAF
jgi:hypothetical protein